MFFLITHILINKYYPSLVTQFIIGLSIFVVSFLIIKDIFSDYSFDQYKYYVLILVAIDIVFLVYLVKFKNDPQKTTKSTEAIEFIKKTENTSTDLRTGTLRSVSLSSEINDYRVGHDFSVSDDGKESIFSNSEESPEKEMSEKSLSITKN